MNGQDFEPPPPPDYQPPANQGGYVAPPVIAPVQDPTAPARKKICPGCSEKIGLRYPRTICLGCGTLFHSKCYMEGSITVSSEAGILLFPNARKGIVEGVINMKLQGMRAVDDNQRNENRNKLLLIPEDELIRGTKNTFCRFCVPKIRIMVPKLAKDFEKAGRHEDAARLLEEFGMIEAAGTMRKKGKAQVVTNISVDLNELLDKLRSGGLVSVYKCPNCGGSIKISGNTSTQKLSKCEYCGTVLQTDDLVNFIRDILS
jgi:hypothetical protein